MNAVAEPSPSLRITAEEYLEREHHAETKSEYLGGAVRAMSGASLKHTQVTRNLVVKLGQRLKGQRCQILSQDMRVKPPSHHSYFYPDLVAYCGSPELLENVTDTLLNPTLVIEVVSPSTEAYDRGEKFFHYQNIPALQQYVLVSQFRPRVEIFTRDEGDRWSYESIIGLEAIARFTSIEVEVPIGEIYREVDLSAPIPDGLR